MTHENRHIQAILEAIHSALRSLSDRTFEYEVEYPVQQVFYRITVHQGAKHQWIMVSKDSLGLVQASLMSRILVSLWIESFHSTLCPVLHEQWKQTKPRPVAA
jgi:hypothetical protein